MIYVIIGLAFIAAFFVMKKLQDVWAERNKMKEMKRRLKHFEETGDLPSEEHLFDQFKRIRFRK